MKKERIRSNKKIMKILKTNGFRDPMQLIIDAEFLKETNKSTNSYEVILRYFDFYPKFLTTRCEFNKFKETGCSAEFSGHVEILKCTCEGKENCLYNDKLIKKGNKNHYILATNKSSNIKKYIKMGVPIFTIRKSVPTYLLGNMKKQIFDYKGKKASEKELQKLKSIFTDE